jgi:vitamin B12/bleomycin/antimicrobial peptide transport system ATP-binding/permease protein
VPASDEASNSKREYLLRRFWRAAIGFWTGDQRKIAWLLTAALVAIIVAQVYIFYRLNVWNREIFDALEKKDGGSVLKLALLYIPLALANIGIAVGIVYARMTTQRRWRGWLTNHIVNRWLENGRYFHLNLVKGDHENPEYRIAEDMRIATESPIDFAAGLLSAFLSAATFIAVLWFVGGALTFTLGGTTISIPGFLVIAAMIYAIFASSSMVYIGRKYISAAEQKMQAEAEFRYALTRLRENGESIALIQGEDEEKIGLRETMTRVLRRWRDICGQYMRTSAVAQTSFIVAPVIPIILSAPKYLAGDMSLGQVMQASSAFVTVQTAFNWLVDNYPRFADWAASARRVSSLMLSLDALEKAEANEGWGRIEHGEARAGNVLELQNVSVALDDGTVIVNEADVQIKPGERVLFVGESGSGKSTLVRAITGLWPWGEGKILTAPNTDMFLMPQKPYIPIGALRRAVIYPKSKEEVGDKEVVEALKAVGLETHVERMDVEGPWDQTLSGGEKQRVAFARLLIHKPQVIVMDEATAALDKASQAEMMQLIEKMLPETTIISVAHRPELEAFHNRKITLEHKPGGARIVQDIELPAVREGLLRKWWRGRDKPPLSVPERHPGDRLSKAEDSSA